MLQFSLLSLYFGDFFALCFSYQLDIFVACNHYKQYVKQSRLLVGQVANLEDILSERGACGVGFIANLENKASHQIVKDALIALGCMEHRGGCGADNDSGDGSGLMSSIPWDLFDDWAKKQGIASFDKLHTGVGMVFLPRDEELLNEAKKGNSVFMLKSLRQLFFFVFKH